MFCLFQLFVLEMTRFACAILAQPISLIGFKVTGLSHSTSKDNWIKWLDKMPKAVWYECTKSGHADYPPYTQSRIFLNWQCLFEKQ